jgi:hypothetical protein
MVVEAAVTNDLEYSADALLIPLQQKINVLWDSTLPSHSEHG